MNQSVNTGVCDSQYEARSTVTFPAAQLSLEWKDRGRKRRGEEEKGEG